MKNRTNRLTRILAVAIISVSLNVFSVLKDKPLGIAGEIE
jgi:hypothetical protein